CQQGYTYPHSF
nr:immunoglobulin light chain junction region [Macaca mulatta]MOV63863.1 immunoglobulin light chain junction region [Macaca mulatta]